MISERCKCFGISYLSRLIFPMKKAIQFIGTQRSGSNLLRVMLNQHPEISAPHPPHILQVMMPLIRVYGDLNSEFAFNELVDDVCTLVEVNPVDWKIKFDRESVASKCDNRSLPQVMKAIYQFKADAAGASVWCCKSMASIHYVNEIESAGIHPVYIFMYRDGRDVACSFRKAVVGEKHMYHLAKQWKSEQDISLELVKNFGSRVVKVKYEDFIHDPVPSLRKICSALEIEFDPAMLDYAESTESKLTAASGKMWSNLTRPVMRENTRKFLKELSFEDLVIFESVAGDTLEALGYAREIPKEKLRVFSEAELAVFSGLNNQWKQEAKAIAIEDMSKRKLQDDYIAQLKMKSERRKV